MAQILNLAAAAEILGGQLTELAERRDALLAQSAAIEKELGELNPRISRLETAFRRPVDPVPTTLLPQAPAPVAPAPLN